MDEELIDTRPGVGKIVTISQPMRGRTKGDILRERRAYADRLMNLGYGFMDTYQNEFAQNAKHSLNETVYGLFMNVSAMANCHAMFFCPGWENHRRCQTEHKIATDYDIDILYEEDLERLEETM